jgi:Fe-S cluster assembly iron-binding protein IscA
LRSGGGVIRVVEARFRSTGAHVLTLTDQAADVVRAMTQDPQAPEHAGVRLALGADAVELSLAGRPGPGDDVIIGNGVRLFVERATSWHLDGHVLDGRSVDGVVSFQLAQPGAGGAAR